MLDGMSDTALRQEVRACFDTDVAIAVRDPDLGGVLLPDERLSDTAVAARQSEFAAGRSAARDAILQMGLPALGVPVGADRTPVWPAGLTGSISHCTGACIAVVGRKPGIRSLGVDVEPAVPLPADLMGIVCTADEIAWLERCRNPGLMAKVVFCIKEAAYKTQYPLTGALFGFERFIASVNCNAQTFDVSFTQKTGLFEIHDRLSGRFRIEDGFVVAGVTLRT